MEVGPSELIIILLIVVLIFGPGRLAGLGSELGRGIRQFRQGLRGNAKNESEIADVDEKKTNDKEAH